MKNIMSAAMVEAYHEKNNENAQSRNQKENQSLSQPASQPMMRLTACRRVSVLKSIQSLYTEFMNCFSMQSSLCN